MARILLTLPLAGAALLAACNPYDPDLGDSPFRCSNDIGRCSGSATSCSSLASETECQAQGCTWEDVARCPDGYTCVIYSPSEQICEQSSGSVPDGGGDSDSGPLNCSGDMEIEPNETIGNARPTGIPESGENYSLLGVLICPSSDIDVFYFRVDITGKNGRIEVNYDESRGPLLVDMLNSTGISIRAGVPTNGDSGKLRADVANMATGVYYAQIMGTDGTTAEYGLTVITSTEPLPQ